MNTEPQAGTEPGDDKGEGGLSQAENLRSDDPQTPVQPDQAVAGAPDAESGDAQEGAAGPNANTNAGDSTGEPVGNDDVVEPERHEY